MDNYKYILQYIDNTTKVTMEFQADVDTYELASNLKQFLLACSWSKEALDEIIIEED